MVRSRGELLDLASDDDRLGLGLLELLGVDLINLKHTA